MLNKIVIAVAIAVGFQMPVANAAVGFVNQKFQKVFYLEAGGKGSENGKSAGNAADFIDGDIMAIEAGMVIEKVYVIVDTAVTSLSLFEVGDDDDADGYVNNVSVTLGTPGMYSWGANAAAVYLAATASGGTDLYKVSIAKHYSAAGKEVKLNVTGTAGAGKARVIVEGYKSAL